MKLYGYWRSSATWRVRLAFALKGLAYDYIPVNLLEAAHQEPAYTRHNPQNLVPTLETDDGETLTQSLAIIRYLDRLYPQTSLLPLDPVKAAKVEAVAIAIACEAQPFANLRVLQYLRQERGFHDDDIADWLNRWTGKTLHAAQHLITANEPQGAVMFSFGNTPGLADIFIIPQLFAARRFGADLTGLDRLLDIERACEAHPAFQAAHPGQQPDAPSDQ